jgi:membrane-bound metal-dependent hydrolase YbcI (DUF457 family)
MLAKSHRLMAASGAVLLGASPLGIAAAALGATLPDRVEAIGLPHRGVSHWPWPWALVVWLMQAQGTEWGLVLAWWFAGALFHIGSDLFTIGGIPLLLPHWRIRLGALRTGEFGEFFVVAVVVMIAAMKVLNLRLVHLGGP